MSATAMKFNPYVSKGKTTVIIQIHAIYIFIYVAADKFNGLFENFAIQKFGVCEESTPDQLNYGRYILAWRFLFE